MNFNYMSSSSDPEMRKILDRASRERAAAFRAAARLTGAAISVPVHRLVEAVARARRARRTFRELEALTDGQLKDIGLNRGEITDVMRIVERRDFDTGITLAEFRRAGSLPVENGESRPVAQLDGGRHPRKGGSRPTPPQTAAAPKHERAA